MFLAIFLLDYYQSIFRKDESPLVLFIGSKTGKNFQEMVQLWFGKSPNAPSLIPKFLDKRSMHIIKSIMDEGTLKTPIPKCRLNWSFFWGGENFVGSEPSQKQSGKPLQNMVYNTSQHPPPKVTHCL
jgi:hypothetical protein